jgi:hypothetical protein
LATFGFPSGSPNKDKTPNRSFVSRRICASGRCAVFESRIFVWIVIVMTPYKCPWFAGVVWLCSFLPVVWSGFYRLPDLINGVKPLFLLA